MQDKNEEEGGEKMSYKKLEIWQLAREMSIEIQKMTLVALPKYEMYEEGSQIRRSVKSVRSNIVEGYGRRRYKHDFIRFLTCAHASCDETVDHLETLFETESLKDKMVYQRLLDRLHTLGRKLYAFVQGVESSHQSVREPIAGYGNSTEDH
jgi:four helix bundle protein